MTKGPSPTAEEYTSMSLRERFLLLHFFYATTLEERPFDSNCFGSMFKKRSIFVTA